MQSKPCRHLPPQSRRDGVSTEINVPLNEMKSYAAGFTNAAGNALEPEIIPPSDVKERQMPVVNGSDATGQSKKKSQVAKI